MTARRALVAALAVLLASLAARALVPAAHALLSSPEVGGVDLQHRMAEVRLLWSGVSPWAPGSEGGDAVYPPASYVMLGPLALGSYGAWAWLWLGSTVALLLALGQGAARVSGASAPEARILAFVLPFTVAGVPYGVQNGQVHVHVVAALVGGMALLLRARPTRATDGLGSVLVLLALIKPTVAGPALLLLLRRDRWAVLAAIVGGYLALTGVGLLLVGDGFAPLADWLFRARGGASWGAGGSYGNLHAWSAMVGLSGSDAALTLVAVLGFGAWVAARPVRGEKRWASLALAAVVARVAVYHQEYDDALLIPVQLALLGEARRAGPRSAPVIVLAALVLVHLPVGASLGAGDGVPVGAEIARPVVWAAAAWICARRVDR